MTEIVAYNIKLSGRFGTRLIVEEVKVFTIKEEAIIEAKNIAKHSNLKYEESDQEI